MRRFFERLLNLLRVRRPDQDLAREIDAHLALLQDTYEARGLSPDAARRAARLAFGNADHVKEQYRDARSFRWIEDGWLAEESTGPHVPHVRRRIMPFRLRHRSETIVDLRDDSDSEVRQCD